jgi:ATP-dependent DNA ligase
VRLILRSHGARSRELAPLPRIARKKSLRRSCGGTIITYSEPFRNAEQLLADCQEQVLEGMVSKRKQPPYR